MADLNFHLVRTDAQEHATLGQLFIDGQHTWFTLEDPWRPNQPKIPGDTCIPAGRYEILVNKSVRFGRMMPLLLNVPNFTGVRIHWGNTDKDTDGCILVGGSCQPDAKPVPRIGDSVVAFADVMKRIADSLAAGNRVWIEIIDPDMRVAPASETEGDTKPEGTQVSPIILPGGVGWDGGVTH